MQLSNDARNGEKSRGTMADQIFRGDKDAGEQTRCNQAGGPVSDQSQG